MNKMKIWLLILFLIFPTNLLGEDKVSNIEKIFEKALAEEGVSFSKVGDRLYKIPNNSSGKIVSLQNIEKNYLRDGDLNAIQRFIENVLQPDIELPIAKKLRKGMFVSLEPSDYEGSNEAIHKKLSNSTIAVLAYFSEDKNQVRWLTTSDLKSREIPESEAWEIAFRNLEAIMSKTSVKFNIVDGENLGVIEAYEPYKASLILSAGLKEKVRGQIGWPIYAVAPARDFVYIFSKKSKLINKVGGVVVDEYANSGYPISTEVWELSDDKQKAIGEYPKK
jgi:uncharacterized protein YtpQ (UPF0354 family)